MTAFSAIDRLPETLLVADQLELVTIRKENLRAMLCNGPAEKQAIADYDDTKSRLYFTFHQAHPHRVGHVEIHVPLSHPDSLAIGYGTRPGFRGLGFAPLAVAAISDHILAEKIVSAIYADIKPENDASARVLEKTGFLETAREACCITTGEPGPVRVFIKTVPDFSSAVSDSASLR